MFGFVRASDPYTLISLLGAERGSAPLLAEHGDRVDEDEPSSVELGVDEVDVVPARADAVARGAWRARCCCPAAWVRFPRRTLRANLKATSDLSRLEWPALDLGRSQRSTGVSRWVRSRLTDE